MKNFKTLSLLGLFAISMAATSDVKAEYSIQFQQEINAKFEALINNQASFDEVICALENAAQQENDPTLLEDLTFLKQNRSKLMLYISKVLNLYNKIAGYLHENVQVQMKNLGLQGWMKVLRS